METQHNMDDRLWDYLDGRGNAAERSSIEELIAQNSAWKEKYRELLDVHALMQGSELDMPSMRFSKNVMEEIAKLHIAPATRTYINNKIIWGLTLFFVTVLIGFLIYGFGQVNWSGGSSGPITQELNKLNTGKLDFSKFFNNSWVNGFMMMNMVLGLFLLDQYLTRKKKAFN